MKGLELLISSLETINKFSSYENSVKYDYIFYNNKAYGILSIEKESKKYVVFGCCYYNILADIKEPLEEHVATMIIHHMIEVGFSVVYNEAIKDKEELNDFDLILKKIYPDQLKH
jgi:hypothetical protein